MESIDVVVGQDEQLFTVYKREICSRSEFFRAATSGRWSKSEDAKAKPIELPEECEFHFDIYLHCVYKDKVDLGSLLEPLPGEEDIPGEDWEDSRLVKTYILEDKLRDAKTTNLIMDDLLDLYEGHDTCPFPEITSLVANNTALESPLRQVFIDYLSYEAKDERTCADLNMPKDFLYDVLKRKNKIVSDNQDKSVSDAFDRNYVRKQKKCRYHQHDDLHPVCGEDCDKGPQAEDAEENGENVETAENDS